MKSILDPAFRYVPSASTDIRKTFARIRRELQRQRAAELDRTLSPSGVVVDLKRKEGT